MRRASALRNSHPALAHTIRLRSAWEIEPLTKPAGHVRCTRHFNKPTGLDHGERVWLVIEGLECPAIISVNGAPVGQASRLPGNAAEPIRCDITPLLAARNKVVIELPGGLDAQTAQTLQHVRLEIDAD